MFKKPNLKEFMTENFDFNTLKKAGFFKGIKKSDYEGQAKKVCDFFGLKSVYEYNEIGKGAAYHITEVASKFDCPICTCENVLSRDDVYFKTKCTGCKRRLIVSFTGAGYRVTTDDKYQETVNTYL